MAEIKLTIPNDKLDRVKNAFKGLFPIPIETNPETGEETPLFTDGAWGKECLRRYIVSVVQRYEQRKAMNEAAKAVLVDEGIAS